METKTKRRTFDEAFKREAVGLLLKGDKPMKALVGLTRFDGHLGEAGRMGCCLVELEFEVHR